MNNQKIFNKNYILLMLVNTLLFISFNMINPILPQYVTSMGMSVTLAGIISGCFSITALIFRPISGVASDRTDPKKLYVIAGIMLTLASGGYALCNGFISLFAVRVVHGIFFAVDSTVSLVMVTQFIPDGKMGQGIGYFGIGPIIAISFAPGLGLKLSATLGCTYSFYIAAVMALVATLVICFISYDSAAVNPSEIRQRAEAAEGKSPLNTKNGSSGIGKYIAVDVIIFAALAGLFSFANSIEYTFMDLYSKSRGIDDISVYFTVSAIFILVSRLFAGKIYDKKGLSVIIYPAFIVCAVAMFVLGHASIMTLFLVAAAVKALGQGAGQPSLQSQCMTTVEKDRLGIASSTYYLGPDIMQGIGPIVGGVVIDNMGYSAVYYLCSILLLVGAGTYAFYSMRQKRTINHAI